MKTFLRQMAVTTAASLLLLGAGTLVAQQGPPGPPPGGPGGFDPAQFRQRMMDNIRERLDVKNDDEWKAIQPLVEKVMEARRDAGPMGMGPMMGRGGRRGGNNGDPNAPRRPRGPFGGQPLPEAEALQQALDSSASKDEIKTKLTALRNALQEKEAKLVAAQEDLKKVLTTKQEASAVLMGLVK